VRFKDVLSSTNSLYIITEFCKDGDLKEIIKRKRFREDEAFDIIKQILSGFTQLVQEKIIHRDLKPANILVNDNVFKIADFGFAKYVDNFGSAMLKSCVGSPIYMAPQILERVSPYTTKCDIWSIGVIFYEMLFGYPPWKARD
jgi:serine/threonine-protein kinase ULK/ATG1